MWTEKIYYVYILASRKNGTLYIGVTNDPGLRVREHREGKGSKFAKKYKINKLVYYEEHGDIVEAIAREKQIKKWRRKWKLELIEKNNPEWKDLYFKFYEG
ncbi:MAG: GIY-YIG nuclease family protein [Patescibacteria group bacterium]